MAAEVYVHPPSVCIASFEEFSSETSSLESCFAGKLWHLPVLIEQLSATDNIFLMAPLPLRRLVYVIFAR